MLIKPYLRRVIMKVASMTVFLLALAPLSANSALVKWTVDIQLDDIVGTGTVTGSFFYDAVTDSWSDVNISAVGDMFPASSATLTSVIIADATATNPDFAPTGDLTGLQDVYLTLDHAMTDAGGVIDVIQVETYECLDADCVDYSSTLYSGIPIAGTVSSVPLPAAAWLFGSGLVGLMGIARTKAA